MARRSNDMRLRVGDKNMNWEGLMELVSEEKGFNVKAEENNNTEFEFELGTSFLIPSISLASVTKNTKCLKVTGKTNDNRDIEVSETREKKVSEQTFPFLPLATIKEKESTKEIVIKTGRDVKKIVKKSSNTSICLLGIPIFGQLECDSDSD